jgi:isopenicillin N synthase-like dioxygenase
MAEQTIPVVDLNDFKSDSSSSREQFVQTVGDALKDIGFFAVENHGVDHDLIKEGYALAEEFFAQSEDFKKSYEIEGGGGQRGYTSFGKESAKDSDAPDLKEFWHVGRENMKSGEDFLPGSNQNLWPSHNEKFKSVFTELYSQLDECASILLQACSLYIQEELNLLSNMAEDGSSLLRIIHYPPVSEDANPASIRAGAHEDINFITLLCESTDEGLELLQRDGKWRPIHALEGQIIADAGDMLQNLTNGLFKSTTHRVVNPDNDRSRRFSMPFFVHPRDEVDLSPLPGCIEKTGGKAKFPSLTAKEYLMQRLRELGLVA